MVQQNMEGNGPTVLCMAGVPEFGNNSAEIQKGMESIEEKYANKRKNEEPTSALHSHRGTYRNDGRL